MQTARALTVVTHRAEATAAELAENRQRVEVLQPRAVAYDILSAAKEPKLISLYAKDIGVPQRRLFAMLDRWDWIFQRTSREMKVRKGPWVGGYRGLKLGYVEHDTDIVDNGVRVVEARQVMITAKGQRVIENLLAQGKLPLNGPRKA
ncbi:phage antirepressor KilAC domain-containing protein [Methylobacterium sp. E-065]|uniref:phage antirepressor KilAC domain-containing protein n=1 Tax=Methylobacterium sp. E-065 TaxID=2836583 RepID=UPI00391B8B3B